MMIINDKIGRSRMYGEYVKNEFAKDHFNAFVVRLCGGRGSGKSLLLSLYAARDLIQGRKVWSNMPVVVTKNVIRWGTKHAPKEIQNQFIKKKAGYLGLSTIPLDWDALYTLSEDLAQGTVIIDEAQYFSDSRSALSMKNRLLNAIVAQVRKRSLNLYYSVKQGDWVDRRLSYETDIQINCHSMHVTPWGKQRNVQPGDVIFTRWYDLSGAVTGNPVDFKDKYVKSYKAGFYSNMHLFWDCYDTSQAVSVEEAFTNVQLDLKKRVISNKEDSGQMIESMREIALSLTDKGTKEISTAGFWGIAESMGIEGSPQHLGRYLAQMGVVRKQKSGGSYYYDLSGLE